MDERIKMINEYFKKLIKKYENGYTPGKQEGKPITKNNRFDYTKFVEYCQNKMRKSTIKTYLSYLHKWQIPLNEETITNWEDSIREINEIRHDYITAKKRPGWQSKNKSKSEDYKINSLKRLSYNLHRALTLYFKATKNKKALKLMPNIKDIKTPKYFVRTGHLTEKEHEKLMKSVEDNDKRLFFNLMFYTGARAYELLNIKKVNKWIPSYLKNKKIKSFDVFEFVIPRGFAKAKGSENQKLFLTKKTVMKDLINKLNNVEHADYLFRFDDFSNDKDLGVIQREKNHLRFVLDNSIIKAGYSNYLNLITLHSFRRSYIHYIYKKSEGDISFTSNCARHLSGISMTGYYLDSSSEKVKSRLIEMEKS